MVTIQERRGASFQFSMRILHELLCKGRIGQAGTVPASCIPPHCILSSRLSPCYCHSHMVQALDWTLRKLNFLDRCRQPLMIRARLAGSPEIQGAAMLPAAGAASSKCAAAPPPKSSSGEEPGVEQCFLDAVSNSKYDVEELCAALKPHCSAGEHWALLMGLLPSTQQEAPLRRAAGAASPPFHRSLRCRSCSLGAA